MCTAQLFNNAVFVAAGKSATKINCQQMLPVDNHTGGMQNQVIAVGDPEGVNA